MEFLTSPDIGPASRWSHPYSANPPPPSSVTVPTNPVSRHPVPTATPNPSIPNPSPQQQQQRHPTPSLPTQNATPTPQHPGPNSTPYFPNLDRAGIKNSFQSLFSPNPNVAATPALMTRTTTAPGITPFINGMQTPGLVPPSAVLSNYPHIRSPHVMSASSPTHDPTMSTPYLQAAAKEAVRREFMSMPSYVTTNEIPPAQGERVVPGNEFGSSGRPPIQVLTKTGSTAPSPVHTSKVTPQHVDAKVPTNASPQPVPETRKLSTPGHSKRSEKDDRPSSLNQHPAFQSYYMPHAQPPPGVVMVGQHGMVMAPPPGPMYAPPPGVMMIRGAQPMLPQGMMMSAPQHIVRQTGPPVKPESASERKARIEHEKQELIREFKKKTREAALVRFRQKRRERRFGKLIRYDCRKKLADARPRVKGRFVRIKADEDDMSEGPQVVPNLER